MLKDRLQMENLTGSKPILIEQDVYASAYLLNVAFDMADEADMRINADTLGKPRKHRMTVSRSLAIGILKDEFMRLVLSDEDKRSVIVDGIAKELRRNLVPVRKTAPTPARARRPTGPIDTATPIKEFSDIA